MIHLVRSTPATGTRSRSLTTSPIAETEAIVHLDSIDRSTLLETDHSMEITGETDPETTVTEAFAHRDNPIDESLTSRALVVVEHLGAMYPVETSRAIAPVSRSSTMEEMYKNLTVQQVSLKPPALKTTVLETHPQLPANTKFIHNYPPNLLQAPLVPIRAQPILLRLPFLEVGSGLLAFTIVSGVVVADGLKQANNMPVVVPGKKIAPISSTRPDRVARPSMTTAAMSEMERLTSGRMLPVPNASAPAGITNPTPAQLSQLTQQAIGASTIGRSIAPPESIIPPIKPFSQPEAKTLPPSQRREAEIVTPQPPISLSAPINQSREPVQRQPIVAPSPFPERPMSSASEAQVVEPASVATASPMPSPMPSPMRSTAPSIRQSMMPMPLF